MGGAELGALKMNISFENKEGLEFLKSIDNNSINLILTDPPYIISKETGMNTFRNSILGAPEVPSAAN